MILNFFSALRTRATNAAPASRRAYVRRTTDRCVSVIAGQTYPVENWSPGGLLLSGDERTFGIGQDFPVSIKFRLRGALVSIDHRGRIVRKGPGKFAVAFAPLNEALRRSFRQVVDDSVANEFADSQAV
jgi:hypothetical protein